MEVEDRARILGERIQRYRRLWVEELSDDEAARHAEENAKRIAEDRSDPRYAAVAPAYRGYLELVNELWGVAVESGLVRRVTRFWRSKRRPDPRYTVEESESDATFAFRAAITHYDPERSTTLETYARVVVFRELDRAYAKAVVPYGISSRQARKGAKLGVAVGLEVLEPGEE